VKGGRMETFWRVLNRLIDFLGAIAVAILFAALTFAVGYQMGFTTGLDTKVTLVKEKYILKVAGKEKR